MMARDLLPEHGDACRRIFEQCELFWAAFVGPRQPASLRDSNVGYRVTFRTKEAWDEYWALELGKFSGRPRTESEVRRRQELFRDAELFQQELDRRVQ